MLYDSYEWGSGWLQGAAEWADWSAKLLQDPHHPFARWGAPVAASALEVWSHAVRARGKPAWGLPTTVVDGRTVAVTEEVVDARPFGTLLRFRREGVQGAPKLLIVAPMSGHYGTLLRGTVERMLPAHDVYVTDWADAKGVPLAAGRFDLDDYIDYLLDWTRIVAATDGRRPHLLAVCQPSVPALAAASLMAAADDPARPATLTMMGGPIDTREAPTSVDDLATERPLAWFRENVIATVPFNHPGAGRRVYPGFLQLAGFLSMNLGSHLSSHWALFKHLIAGDHDSADATKAFYEEYRSVADMTAEFYLQTIETVFQRHALPRGEMNHRGTRVDIGAIRDIAMLAIEGERDDISGLGQTKAALTLATGLPEDRKRYHMAQGAGHYGIFNGSKWRGEIAPVVEAWVRRFEG